MLEGAVEGQGEIPACWVNWQAKRALFSMAGFGRLQWAFNTSAYDWIIIKSPNSRL